MWCNNKLNTMGKWGGVGFLFGIAITAFVFQGNNFVHAYILETTALIQPTELKLDFNQAGKINNITTDIDFSKFFSSSRVSPNDIMSFLKEATVTAINLTILIISITSQVLKGLLSVIKVG